MTGQPAISCAMTHRGLGFLRDWIEDNINLDALPLENDPQVFAAKCLADAATAGLSRADIEGETGSIEERILEAMSDAADNELHRRPEKDN
jgi:hypothetical protein